VADALHGPEFAGVVRRYRQRDMVGMAACLIMAGLGFYLLFR
jgi:hypothetical protein